MKQIEVTPSAKAYLDAFEQRIGDDDADPNYSAVIERLQGRSWNAAHGGGCITLDADDMDINDDEPA